MRRLALCMRLRRPEARNEAALELGGAAPAKTNGVAGPSTSPAPADASAYAEQLAAVPDLASYGPVLQSTRKPVPLTESETEYVVTAVKHVFKEHVVFQFNIRNTLPDTILEQVAVVMTPTSGETGLTEDFIIPVPLLKAEAPGTVYVSFSRDSPADFAVGSFSNVLKFTSKEVDPDTGEPEEDGYADEYQVEEVELGAGDYISPAYVAFSSEFDRLRTAHSQTETFALTALESIQGA